jgi:hypothetical protein
LVWSTRRRAQLGAAAVVILVTGLAMQAFRPATWADVAGTALYAALVYVVLATVWPSTSPLHMGLTAAAVCVGVELLQLTSIPVSLSAAFDPARLVLGTTFAWADLSAYLAGAGLAAVLDEWWTARSRKRRITRTSSPPSS